MLISSAPVALPVSTANPPTEAVAAESAQKNPVPEPKSTTDSPKARKTADTAEQQRANVESNSPSNQRDRVDKEGEQSGQSRQDQNSQQQAEGQESRQEKRQELQEQRIVDELKRTDLEVKAHERAHAAVGGQYAGAPSYTYTTGPDGKRYAIAGEVSIDTSRVPGDPQATIQKMQQVQRAALAPADPSGQDLKVAAIAGQIANQARVELSVQRTEEAQASNESNNDTRVGEVSVSVSEENDGFSVTNPVAARRASLALNQRIANSGALEDLEQQPLLSQTA
ncbi:hypothetical protein FLL45_15900 [Aliikangiella marina]|uniref:Catalase n=1 Tax=Aliikangiella marina TaxID=1712262 RepID=A0A545T6Y5_9GAMM|nr:putative metalloprotease CJM1_0395 family protein [Aliikangiella marina]TQV72945.1 hypothetical protein FLL45_15900 [Aliikangiella marina]